MAQRAVYSRLNIRIAEEKQLLSEEKWIIDALNKIRKQRNCLQIERLELENLKTQLAMKSRSLPSPVQAAPTPVETAMKLMTSNTAVVSAPLATRTELEDAMINELTDNFCNEQELNLTVTNPILSLNYDTMMEEEEEEIESDDSEESQDGKSLLIDMNMFMNGDCVPGKLKSKKSRKQPPCK